VCKTSLETKCSVHSISPGAYVQMHHASDLFTRVVKFKKVSCHSPRCARPTALERQDFSRTYLAHHELESVIIITIITIFILLLIMIDIIIIIIIMILTGSMTQPLT